MKNLKNTKHNNKTMKNKITMPDRCRYMSEYSELMEYLPIKGWYMLNKGLCGCGGTTVFLESDRDVILVSPRTNMLLSKHKQYPESTHLFRDEKLKSDKPNELKEYLRNYLSTNNTTGFPFKRQPKKILVTIDSYKYVAEVLSECNRLRHYLVVVDECQCLMSDASFKGQAEMEFLEILRRTTPNVCFMSATPIPEEYLDYVEYFAGIPYYQLEWDPRVMETPNMKLIMMKKDESARIICRRIIEDYRHSGYFARKLWNGEVVYSREICIFLNDVSDIIRIIKDNHLRPEEVTILCSEYANKKSELLSMGFKIGGQCTNKDNPVNKTFTFLTSASFEGMDLYSDNAYTVAFFNAHKEWETHDISIELPQIMARQRLESNPFRRDAEVFYKTNSEPKTKDEICEEVQAMISASNSLISKLNEGDPVVLKGFVDYLRKIPPTEKFKDYFIDVVDLGSDGYGLKLNMMVVLARMNLWVMQNYYYKQPIKLVAGSYDKMGNNYIRKSDEQIRFECAFGKCKHRSEKQLMTYAEYRELHPEQESALKANPHIPVEIHQYYDILGKQRMEELRYNYGAINNECLYQSMLPQIIERVRRTFIPGQFYSNVQVKQILCDIFTDLKIPMTPSAVDITRYINAVPKNAVFEDGSRIRGYIVKVEN